VHLEGFGKLKKISNLVGTRSRDLPVGTAPQRSAICFSEHLLVPVIDLGTPGSAARSSDQSFPSLQQRKAWDVLCATSLLCPHPAAGDHVRTFFLSSVIIVASHDVAYKMPIPPSVCRGGQGEGNKREALQIALKEGKAR
jgi:hypothetical protein